MFDEIVEKDCLNIIKNINLNKIKGKKILVLGGNSFIGNYIQAVLSLVHCKIVSVSLNGPRGIIKNIPKKNFTFIRTDLNNEKRVKKILNSKFDFIFHLATYGQPQKWKQNELSTIYLNISLLRNVLNHSIKFNSRVLYMSSAAVYELPKTNSLINENSKLSFGSFDSEIVYANSKIIGEQLCRIYKEKFDIPVYVVRPAHKNIFLFDKGKSIRTWGYIADITSMILNIVQFGKSTTYNVSGINHKSIIQIAKIISKFFDNKKIIFKNKKLIFTNPKPSILKISSKKYNSEFKNKFKTNFIDGIKKTIKWNRIWQKLN